MNKKLIDWANSFIRKNEEWQILELEDIKILLSGKKIFVEIRERDVYPLNYKVSLWTDFMGGTLRFTKDYLDLDKIIPYLNKELNDIITVFEKLLTLDKL